MRSAAIVRAAPRSADRPEDDGPPPLVSTSRGPTVLVADGDPAVRAMVARTLQLMGHASVSATDGSEVLALACHHAPSLALLVVEVSTPGLGRTGLARAIRALRPRVPVLLISEARAARDLGEVVVGRPATFLPKPFSAEELCRAISELAT